MSDQVFQKLFEKEQEAANNSPQPTLDESLKLVLNFGKFKGKDLGEILLEDEGGIKYIKWLSEWSQARPEQVSASMVILMEYRRRKNAENGRAGSAKKRKSKSV